MTKKPEHEQQKQYCNKFKKYFKKWSTFLFFFNTVKHLFLFAELSMILKPSTEKY